MKDILARLENMEKNGYAFESADASFKLLVQKVLKKHTPYFELLGFNVAVQKKDVSSKAMTLATIKISVKGQTELAAGEGAGPVDALNSALRTVLRRFYPSIDSVDVYKRQRLCGRGGGLSGHESVGRHCHAGPRRVGYDRGECV